jgi:carbonic anhydrase
MDDALQDLIRNNRAWAERMEAEHPGFFDGLKDVQQPHFLWIGCSDSRVPANQIVDLKAGDVFVHRNVANIVHQDDTNAMAVIEFAVEALGVQHIIVCGHYGCGGVQAALDDSASGRVRDWVAPIRALATEHAAELGELADLQHRSRRLCELNVLAQAREVLDCSVIREANAAGHPPHVHAWIYDVADGLLQDLSAEIA